MLSDLDALMSARGIGAVIAPMHEAMHASFRWLARGAPVTRGYAIKKVGAEPRLFTYGMERDEAARSGLEVVLVVDKRGANLAEGYAELYESMLGEVEGAIAFYGNVPVQCTSASSRHSNGAGGTSTDRTAKISSSSRGSAKSRAKSRSSLTSANGRSRSLMRCAPHSASSSRG
jgi:hypothetical protein